MCRLSRRKVRRDHLLRLHRIVYRDDVRPIGRSRALIWRDNQKDVPMHRWGVRTHGRSMPEAEQLSIDVDLVTWTEPYRGTVGSPSKRARNASSRAIVR